MPKVNDTIRISNAVLDNQLDFQSTGANYSWDFSSLQFNGQKRNDYRPVSQSGMLIQVAFGSFAPPKYKATYFLPTVSFPQLPSQLPISIQDINQFYKLTADSMTMVGLKLTVNGQEIPAKSDTIETKYHFPITYGDSYVSRGATDLDLNPVYDGNWRQHRKRETEVDGWGSITTPYGTFDVLRIHHKIIESDSFYVSFNGFGTWINIPVPESHEYEWRAKEEKEPILMIRTSVVQGSENITAIEYRNNFVLGLEDSKDILVSMYPNPAQNELNISSEAIFDHYAIFGMDGKKILEGDLNGAGQQTVNVAALHKGTYLIRLQSANGTAVKTFVK